jgi:hypothetical protein
VRWLLSSRPEVFDHKGIEDLKNLHASRVSVTLDPERLKGPVNAYIGHKLDSMKGKDGYDTDTLAILSDEIRQRAMSTFPVGGTGMRCGAPELTLVCLRFKVSLMLTYLTSRQTNLPRGDPTRDQPSRVAKARKRTSKALGRRTLTLAELGNPGTRRLDERKLSIEQERLSALIFQVGQVYRGSGISPYLAASIHSSVMLPSAKLGKGSLQR